MKKPYVNVWQIFMVQYSIMKYFIFILLNLLIFLPVEAKHIHTEKEYQAYWCEKHNGQMEYILPNKARVDCLLPDMAVEVDFAKKFHECIGQALEYSKWTHKTPACLLIVEQEKDWKYVKRLRYTVYKNKNVQAFRTFTIKPDALNTNLQNQF